MIVLAGVFETREIFKSRNMDFIGMSPTARMDGGIKSGQQGSDKVMNPFQNAFALFFKEELWVFSVHS